MNNDRFKDAIWAKEAGSETIIIGGAGGIGSWLSLFLSRIGYRLFLYDFDNFDETNLSGQFTTKKMIGLPKVAAIRQLCIEFTGNYINTFNEKFTRNSMHSPIMAAAFDNMEARKLMFNVWRKYHGVIGQSSLFIDGRLDLERLQIFCVTPETADLYEEKYLFDDSEVPDAACTLKQTSHVAGVIAGIMTAFITNYVSNRKGKMTTNPFFYEQYFPLNIVNQEFPEEALNNFIEEKAKTYESQNIQSKI